MKKYVVCIEKSVEKNAGSKARRDAETILLRRGYEPIRFRGENFGKRNPLKQAKLFLMMRKNWKELEEQAEENSLIVIQYPHYPVKTAYFIHRMMPGIRKRKGIRFIALIHDLNCLRGMFGRAAEFSDTVLLKQFDGIICHNEKMKEWLTGQGIGENRIVSLELFDYLTEAEERAHGRRDGIAVAGNLDPEKCGYVEKLAEMERETVLHLYGTGMKKEPVSERTQYHGAFAAEELPGEIEGAFGVVWDGPETDGCTGETGGYLRWNNPHKLSLYMAAGMPAIIWEEAAEAGFVKDKGVGMTVRSLGEIQERINGITEEEYEGMKEKVKAIGRRVREGKYLEEALNKTERFWG